MPLSPLRLRRTHSFLQPPGTPFHSENLPRPPSNLQHRKEQPRWVAVKRPHVEPERELDLLFRIRQNIVRHRRLRVARILRVQVAWELHLPRTAALVVEVAVSSEASDREMIKACAEAGVAECWLVLARKQEIECYARPVAVAYQERRRPGPADTFTAAALPEISLPVASLFY